MILQPIKDNKKLNLHANDFFLSIQLLTCVQSKPIELWQVNMG